MTHFSSRKWILTALTVTGLTLSCLHAQPQRRANIWHFGYGVGMDFSCGRPISLSNTKITSVEGATGICDEAGNLLFYTNCGGGKRNSTEISGGIWNRNKELMYDLSNTIGGGISSAQGGVIVPDPASNTRYYLFLVDEVESIGSAIRPHRGLTYFLVDMNQDGGLGGVTKVNMPVFQPAAECVTAARHSNGTDYWILTVDFESRDLVAVLVTATGVRPPVRYARHVAVGPYNLKMSPDGQFLFDGTDLYRFDASNGSILWIRNIDNANNYTYSFSPSSRYLYIFLQPSPRALVRYDLHSTAIGTAYETVMPLGDRVTGYMQIGPDGNIYFASFDFVQGLDREGISVIQCPDSETPKVVYDALYHFVSPIIGRNAGLNNIADFWFDDLQHKTSLDTIEKKMCAGTTLDLRPSCKGESYAWSTGTVNSVLPVTEPGLYRVSITSGCFTVVESYEVVRGEQPEVTLEHAPFDDFCAALPLTVYATTAHADTLFWSTGATAESITVEYGGQYTATAANTCGEAVAVLEFPTDLCCSVFVPNVFSPERPGLNEQFQVAPFQCPFTEFQLRIHSRWGELAFESHEPAVAWDGISGGKKWPAAVYLWTISYRLSNDPQQRLIRRQGDVTLLR